MSFSAVTAPKEALTLSRAEAMKLAGIGRSMLDPALQSGELPSIRVGKPGTSNLRYRIRRADLEQWLYELSRRRERSLN